MGDPFSEPDAPAEPPRIVWSVGGGVALRVVQDLDFSQDRAAPGFVDLFGAFVFPGSGIFRHGAGLGLSLNISGDGGCEHWGGSGAAAGPEPSLCRLPKIQHALRRYRQGWCPALP